jgi:SAM-dependent methyltransferase/methyltransferase-like protein
MRASSRVPYHRGVAENPYHAVPYLTHPRFETHPDRLGAVATLLGMHPAPVRGCRVLEIGCGDGNNILPMAFYLPESRFVGVDLAEQPIATAQHTILELGLGNIEMVAADLRTIGADYGEFDYIIAHGLYSWVPAEIRDALLSVCRARLAPQGVAFISYNALPGRHIRQMLREMMLHHTRHSRDANQRLEQGRWFLEWLGKSRAVPSTWRAMLDEEIPRLLGYQAGNLAHDDLGEINDSFYFHQFAAHAAVHGLQYLGDAANHQLFDGRGALKWLHADAVERAQYTDFLHLTAFGETLLCRDDVTLDRTLHAELFDNMLFSAPARMVDGQIEGAHGVRLSPGQPAVEAVAEALGQSYPLPVAFGEMLESVENRDALRNILAAMVFSSFAYFHVHDFACQRSVTAKPVGSRLARYQALESNRVTSVRHGTVELDEPGRQLLLLLDGTRDRKAIARAMAKLDGAPPKDEVERILPESLEWLAGMGLLEG